MPIGGLTNTLPHQRWYSTTAAARALGVSVGTVQQMVEDGRLRAWKTTGGHRRIDGLSLEALVNEPSRSDSLTTPRLLIYCAYEQQRWSADWAARHSTQWHIELFDEPMALLLALSSLNSRHTAGVLLLDLCPVMTAETQQLLAQLASAPELWPRFCVLGLGDGALPPLQPAYLRWVCFQPLTPDVLQGYLTALQMHPATVGWHR